MTLNEYIAELQKVADIKDQGNLPVVAGDEISPVYLNEVTTPVVEVEERDYADTHCRAFESVHGLVVILQT